MSTRMRIETDRFGGARIVIDCADRAHAEQVVVALERALANQVLSDAVRDALNAALLEERAKGRPLS